MSRFGEPPDPLFQRINSSIDFDWRLGPYDVEQSRAHARALRELGVPVTTRFYDGQHDWPYWQRELHEAYPMLMDALGTR